MVLDGQMTDSQRSRAARRLDGFGTTIFTEMSALAVRTGAVNLGQGFPDRDGPPGSGAVRGVPR